MDETPASAKRNTTMEKRLKILDEMVYDDRCCHDVAHRNRVVKKIAKDNGLSEKTILRWYYAYLAKGKRGLLPAARIHEIVEAPEEAGMKRAISRYYYSPVKMSLRGAYEMYLMDECRTEDGRLQDERPPFSKFKSVYNKMRSDYRKIISRQGIGEFQKNYRPLLGQAVDVAPLCGHFEMDATSADIELVSKYSRQSVGRPYVYLVVDVFSRLIAGFYVDFNKGLECSLLRHCEGIVKNSAFPHRDIVARFGDEPTHKVKIIFRRTRVHQLLSGPAISLHRFFDEKFLMRGECIRNVTIWANHNFYGCVIGQGFVPLNIKWQSIDLFFGQLPHSSLSFEIHVTIRTARPRALAISIMCLVPRL